MPRLEVDPEVISEAPHSRLPARRGRLFLVGSSRRPEPKDGTYRPCWHLVTWAKNRSGIRYAFMRETGETDRWSGQPIVERILRWWAYVARCGAGRRYPLPLLAYGVPTCSRCRKRAGLK